MMALRRQECTCGSKLRSTWQYDARGIPLFRTCWRCHAEKMATIVPEVLTNPDYVVDEPIEGDTDDV